MAMNSCVLRFEKKLKTVKHDTNKTIKEIAQETRNIERWLKEVAKGNEMIEKLKEDIFKIEAAFINGLQEEEEQLNSAEKEVCCLRKEIDELLEDIKNLQKAFLEAEKRWKLAVEARERHESERNQGGEVGGMKQEIHRMEVRYAQLQKAQEKLMVDLELSVSRRERILNNAESREIRSRATGKQYSREQIKRKIEEFKNKVLQTKRHIKDLAKNKKCLLNTLRGLENDYSKLVDDMDCLQQSLNQLEKELDEGQFHKHFCLEAIVYNQKRVNLLQDFKYGRYKTMCRNRNQLSKLETQNAKTVINLKTVVENLKEELPVMMPQIRPLTHLVTLLINVPTDLTSESSKDDSSGEVITTISVAESSIDSY